MKRTLTLLLALVMLLSLGACGDDESKTHTHKWEAATCTTAKTCKTCGETKGEPLGHKWIGTDPRKCEICGNVENQHNESVGGAEGSYFEELAENQYYFATIKIVEYGTIKVQLDHTKAPITVANFVKLAREKFYDGLTFHRIIPGFMMQGGRTSVPEKTPDPIVGEFPANGYDYNTITHNRGVISMARSLDNYNSASSQFFIMHLASPHLDGDYAAFGYVVEGISVVDMICYSVTPTDNNGSVALTDQPVIESITITIGTAAQE